MADEKLIDVLKAGDQTGEYVGGSVDAVATRDLSAGDLVYVPTEKGSHYIFEIMSVDDQWTYGLLSRRGDSRLLDRDSYTLRSLDDVRVKLFRDHDIKVGTRTTVFSMDEEKLPVGPMQLSKTDEGLQVLKPIEQTATE